MFFKARFGQTTHSSMSRDSLGVQRGPGIQLRGANARQQARQDTNQSKHERSRREDRRIEGRGLKQELRQCACREQRKPDTECHPNSDERPPCCKTFCRTSRRLAPGAIRIPNSRVRSNVTYDTTP